MPLVEQHSDIIRLEPPSLLLEFGRSNSCVFLPTIPTMAQRSRQLLADMYSRLVTDQTALKSLTSSTKPLRTFAHELASLTSKPEAVLGEDVTKSSSRLLFSVVMRLLPLTTHFLPLSMTSFLHFHQQLSMPTHRSCATFHTCRTSLPDQISIRL